MRQSSTFVTGTVLAVLGLVITTTPSARRAQVVAPTLQANLVAHYAFDHPVAGDPSREADLGPSDTPITLINGGAAMKGQVFSTLRDQRKGKDLLNINAPIDAEVTVGEIVIPLPQIK